jgi:hypothetical protein
MNENKYPDHMEFRLRCKDAECEIKGPREVVEPRIADVVQIVFAGSSLEAMSSVQGSKFVRIEEKSTPLLTDNGAHQTNQSNISSDLLTFYQQIGPKNQWEQLLVITYHHIQTLGEPIILDGFKEAYKKLRRLGISEPKNISARANDAITRGLLYCPNDKERNREYLVTEPGENLIQEMMNR